MNSIALQESELNNIERDLKNPVLRAKRESLTPQMGSIQVWIKEQFLIIIFLMHFIFKKLNAIFYFKF